MNRSRRALLRASGTALAVGLSGCVYLGPFKWTGVSAFVREPFESDPPTSVPLTVDVAIQNVNSKDVALRGVDLQLLDEAREPFATRHLGEFTWRGAPPEQRKRNEYDTGLIGTTTAYTATWTLERTVQVDAVPEWITFEVDEVWFGDDDAEEAFVGEAAASTPPPKFTAKIQRLTLDRPVPPTVEPDDYRQVAIHHGVGEDEPIVPTPTPTPTATPTATPNATAIANETASPNGATPRPTTRNGTATPNATPDGTATPNATSTETDGQP